MSQALIKSSGSIVGTEASPLFGSGKRRQPDAAPGNLKVSKAAEGQAVERTVTGRRAIGSSTNGKRVLEELKTQAGTAGPGTLGPKLDLPKTWTPVGGTEAAPQR